MINISKIPHILNAHGIRNETRGTVIKLDPIYVTSQGRHYRYVYFIYFNIDIYKYNQYKTITNNATLHLQYSQTSSPSIDLKRRTEKNRQKKGKNKTFYYTKKMKSGVRSTILQRW